VLHDPEVAPRESLSKEQYMSGGAQATTINHFYEKLLKLKVGTGLRDGSRCFSAECPRLPRMT
jgi:hypothetical protein